MHSLRVAGALFIITSLAVGQTSVDRDVSWKELIPNILEDQKQIWTYPARSLEGHNIIPTVTIAGAATATILWGDPTGAHYFRNTNQFHDFNSIFASTNTSLAIALAPAPLYVAGQHPEKRKGNDNI